MGQVATVCDQCWRYKEFVQYFSRETSYEIMKIEKQDNVNILGWEVDRSDS